MWQSNLEEYLLKPAVKSIWQSSLQTRISIAGNWEFSLDPDNRGLKDEWYRRKFCDRIELPGSLQAQGYGDDITTATPWVSSLHDEGWYLREEYRQYGQEGHVKVPFCLQPKKHYLGVAWYAKAIEVPALWAGKRVMIELERPHWETTMWFDGECLGTQNSLSTPHLYELGLVEPGRHRIVLRISNENILPIRPDSHTVTDAIGASWNGVVGRMEIVATSPVFLDDVQVYPDIVTKEVLVRVHIGTYMRKVGHGMLAAEAFVAGMSSAIGKSAVAVEWSPDGGSAELHVALDGSASLWDEYHANPLHLDVSLRGDGADDSQNVPLGLREIKTCGNRFFVNGRRTHFRGTHDGGCYPLTGYPDMGVKSWKHIINICQCHGLNLIRFHSWCPPEAAFEAADALGFYLQPECGMWPRLDLGSAVSEWLQKESDRICKCYGNHPSFVLLSAGNEPAGKWYEVLPGWAHHCRENDPRHLYAYCTGREAPTPREGMTAYEYWNRQKDAQYLTVIRVTWDGLRGPAAFHGMDYRKTVNALRMPVMGHEVGQWCAYPNYDEMKKYTGFLQPFNYEIFRDSLAKNGMLAQTHDFYIASGKFQLMCYKQEIEANLRTPGMGGIQLLDLHDYPGQGTSFVGIRDMFWDAKEYASPAQFRRFCNHTVPLARFYKCVFTSDETVVVPIDAYHYDENPVMGATLWWKVTNRGGTIMQSGEIPDVTLPLDGGIPVGEATLELGSYQAPAQYCFTAGFMGTPYENDWNFWVYPSEKMSFADVLPTDSGVNVTAHFDGEAKKILAAGGKVLYLAISELSWNNPPVPFMPIFWNRQFNLKWDRALGLLCRSEHPALAEFPTDSYSDWQWEDVIKPECRAVNMTEMPHELAPIVQPIDDWNRNWKLGMLFECKAGGGSLMVCAANLSDNLAQRPAARQLRRSVLHYMESEAFHPKVEIPVELIEGLLFDCDVMAKLGAKAVTDDEETDFKAQNALDGNPSTCWMSAGGSRYPHEFTVELKDETEISGFILMQQQNDFHCLGHIREYRIYAGGTDGRLSLVIEGELASTVRQQKVLLRASVRAKVLRFVAISNYRGADVAALSEFAVITGSDVTQEPIEREDLKDDKPESAHVKKAISSDLDDPTDS
jgi:beta-galactosidase